MCLYVSVALGRKIAEIFRANSEETFHMLPNLYEFKYIPRLATRSDHITFQLSRCNYADIFVYLTFLVCGTFFRFGLPFKFVLQKIKCNFNHYIPSSVFLFSYCSLSIIFFSSYSQT